MLNSNTLEVLYIICLDEYFNLYYCVATRVPASYPIILAAMTNMEYFQPRVPFSITGFLISNPFLTMSLVMMLTVAAFPSILKIDPDALEEAQKDMSDMSEKMERLQGSLLGKNKEQ